MVQRHLKVGVIERLKMAFSYASQTNPQHKNFKTFFFGTILRYGIL